jgi:GTP-binding protein
MGISDEGENMSVVKYLIPTRGMLGLRSEMLTATRGTAMIDAVFDSYRPKIKGDIQSRDKGSLLAFEDGIITSFGLENAQDRGKLFVTAGEETYKNMSKCFI